MNEWTIRVSIACVFTLLGWIIGHRLALGREKRKEYNEAIEIIRGILLNNQEVPASEFKKLESVLGERSKKILKVYREQYKPSMAKAHSLCTPNDYGQYAPAEGKEAEFKAIWENAQEKLLKACKLK